MNKETILKNTDDWYNPWGLWFLLRNARTAAFNGFLGIFKWCVVCVGDSENVEEEIKI